MLHANKTLHADEVLHAKIKPYEPGQTAETILHAEK
jgi:hypothetical protein